MYQMSFHVGIDPINGIVAAYNEKSKEELKFEIKPGKLLENVTQSHLRIL